MVRKETQAEDRDRSLGAPVELRVHGVGGTAPEVLLGHPHPVQVGGDDSAGFFRSPDSDQLEAYSWGGITSRSGSRALWLLILPFALANAAGFMFPTNITDDRARIGRALVRLLALAVTILAALWAGGIGADLLGFQCGGSGLCRGQHWWLTFFGNPFFADRPARRVVIGLAVPVLLIAVWRFATRFTRTRYESVFRNEPVEAHRQFEGDLATEVGVADFQFWHSASFGASLASAHFAGATSALAIATTMALIRLREEGGLGAGRDRALFWVGVFLLIGAGASVVFPGKGSPRLLAQFGWATLAAVVLNALLSPGPANPPPNDLPGYSRLALTTGLVALALAIALLLTLQPRQGFKPAATTGLGLLALVSLLAGSHVRLADWLGARVSRSETEPTIIYSFAYDWFALLSLFLVVGGLVGVVITWMLIQRRTASPGAVEEIASEYPEVPADLEGLGWIRSIIRSRSLARLTDEIGVGLGLLLALMLGAALLFYGVRVFTTGSPFGAFGPLPGGWRSLVPVASWVGSLLPLVGLAVMYSSFRNPGTRRRVGVIWDVLTFWPRWFHPLAPPPYAARAVPELGIRLARLTDNGARVTLSAHSQGSVLAASSIIRLPTSVNQNLALLTHGSPLRRLYGAFFPRYFGQDRLGELSARVGGRWLNLYRLTDPIGGPIGVNDRLLADPVSGHRQPGDPLPRVEGHTFYRGPGYEQAIEDLKGRI